MPLSAITEPRRLGVLINPLSGKVRRQRGRFERLIGQLPRASVAQVCNAVEVHAAIAGWGLSEHDLLVVVGGDGTLQAALTSLLSRPATQAPRVLIVPAGTTNMSAKAIGVPANPFKAIEALTRWLHGDRPACGERPIAVLQVRETDNQQAQCGLFFGAGAIVAGVRYFHERIRPTGIRGLAGPLTAFVRMLLAVFSPGSGHLLPAVDAHISVNGNARQAPWLLVLATTLDTLLMGSRPFWGAEPYPMRLTAISQPPARLCRALPAVLRGRPSIAMRQDPGYLSHNTQHAAIDHLREYLLDGEIFPVAGQIEIQTSAPVRFVTL